MAVLVVHLTIASRTTCYNSRDQTAPKGKNMKPKSWISTFVCLLYLSAAAFGQDLAKAKPDAEGFSPERLERIGAAVQRSIDGTRRVQ